MVRTSPNTTGTEYGAASQRRCFPTALWFRRWRGNSVHNRCSHSAVDSGPTIDRCRPSGNARQSDASTRAQRDRRGICRVNLTLFSRAFLGYGMGPCGADFSSGQPSIERTSKCQRSTLFAESATTSGRSAR